MSKYEDTRIVTFKEDYSHTMKNKSGEPVVGPDGKVMRRVFYKKNSQHAIHYKLVAKLEKNGAKMEVKELDLKKVYEAKRKELAAKRKKQIEVAYSA